MKEKKYLTKQKEFCKIKTIIKIGGEMLSITKEKLSKMYSEMNNAEICKKLNITNPTLVSYLKYYDIKLKGKGNRENKRKVKLVK